MALIARISRLFTADLHAVLDQLEEPEALLKQAIREMDEEIAKEEQRLKHFAQERAALDAKRAETSKLLAVLDERLDLAFDAGNEDLARQVTRRKLETRRFAERLDARGRDLDGKLADLDCTLAANRDRVEGMRQKAEIFCRSETRDDSLYAGIDDTEVELAFLEERQARAKTERTAP